MKALDLFSEPFAPTGSVAAKGVREALGRPALDTMAVLVREAVQNSWDARYFDAATIEFAINAQRFTGAKLDAWREVFSGGGVEGLPLGEVLSDDSLDVVIIDDRGTSGLGGPTRSDVVSAGESSDFVDFVRNVGQPRDTHLGGGTYGYGKSVFFLTSEASTILVYTRVDFDGKFQSRLIGSGLGDGFDVPGNDHTVPYTGRHWWGDISSGVVEPIIGDEADRIAGELGFRTMEGTQTGTSIAIVGFAGLDAEGGVQPLGESVAIMAEAIAWYCWPKFEIPGQPDQISFSVRCNGNSVSIPGSVEIPALDLFRRSLATLLGSVVGEDAGSVVEIRSQRPIQQLGKLAVTDGLVVPPVATLRINPIASPVHHVALMRDPRLIVKYEQGTPLSSPHVQWAGVFMTDPQVDDVFAESEPPTHDDWVSVGLEKPGRTYVNVAYTRIREAVERLFSIGQFAGSGSEVVSLGALSHRLGSLLEPSEGTGARSKNKEKTRPSIRLPGGSVTVLDGPEVILHEGERAQFLRFEVKPAGPSTFRVDATVVVDGGRAGDEPPLGLMTPRVLSLKLADEMCTDDEAEIQDDVVGELIVSVPDDTMVRVGFDLDVVDGD